MLVQIKMLVLVATVILLSYQLYDQSKDSLNRVAYNTVDLVADHVSH